MESSLPTSSANRREAWFGSDIANSATRRLALRMEAVAHLGKKPCANRLAQPIHEFIRAAITQCG